MHSIKKENRTNLQFRTAKQIETCVIQIVFDCKTNDGYTPEINTSKNKKNIKGFVLFGRILDFCEQTQLYWRRAFISYCTQMRVDLRKLCDAATLCTFR